MTNPITPPPELVQEWAKHILTPEEGNLVLDLDWFATQAAQWGADQELDKSNNWLVLNGYGEAASRLRATRRPKSPSLKEQALAALEVIPKLVGFESERDTIRAALEALPNG